MGRRICGKVTASIGLIVFCQTVSAALDSSAAMMAGDSGYRNMLQPDGSRSDVRSIAAVLQDSGSRSNDSGTRFDLNQSGVGPLAQAGQPAAPAPNPVLDSSGPHAQPPAVSSPPNPTSTAVVVRAGPTATGCGLRYLAAELAGKLKGRKWKEFREEECGAITTQAVFPSAIAPKYSGESPDKARTLTCADQFKANKATNANDGMKWIEKGGGYYSECVSRLKG
jgi:hypothetical protein